MFAILVVVFPLSFPKICDVTNQGRKGYVKAVAMVAIFSSEFNILVS